MAEMAAAVRAQDFRAVPAIAVVLALNDRAFGREIGKTRPAAAGIKLVFRREQYRAARRAAINARLFRVPVFASERPFRARLAQDVVLFGRQDFAPFVFRALEGEFHG